MLYRFLEEKAKEKAKPQTLDNIMEFIDRSDNPIPRSTIRARLSEMRKKGIKIDDEVKQIERKGNGWIIKNAKS